MFKKESKKYFVLHFLLYILSIFYYKACT